MIKFFVPGLPQTAGSKDAFMAPKGKGALHRFIQDITIKTRYRAVPQDILKCVRTHFRSIVTDNNRKGKAWRKEIAKHAPKIRQPLQGPLALSLTFYLPRPKGHYRSGKYSHLLKDFSPIHPITKPDATKLLRCAEDALAIDANLMDDDAQIVDQLVRKRYAAKEQQPGVSIVIEQIESMFEQIDFQQIIIDEVH